MMAVNELPGAGRALSARKPGGTSERTDFQLDFPEGNAGGQGPGQRAGPEGGWPAAGRPVGDTLSPQA